MCRSRCIANRVSQKIGLHETSRGRPLVGTSRGRPLVGALLGCWLILAACCPAAGRAEAPKTPNFVIALADDLGYGDLACFGHPVIKTPHLDRLAQEGMRLTNCYAAAANCSPARTGLLTGRTPYRVGIHNWIPHSSPMHVRRQEITVATLLRNRGYSTCHSGKWHLNGKFNSDEQPQPCDHGFDHWFSTQNNAMPWHENPDNFVRNGEPVGQLEGYSGHLVVDEAIRWLRELRDPKKPFFLYVCFHEPHEPIATAERYKKLYPSVDHPNHAAHHGNVTQMDDAMGRLLAALDDMKLRDETLVLFTSDNGPAITRWHPYGSAGPLREKKGHVYEGGIRVPGIIRWPGHVEPGTVCDEPICGVDLLPTLCALAGAEVPKDRAIDGASFAPIFEGKPIDRTTPLYWQFNYARSAPKVAMRIGPWKLLASLDVETPKPTADIRPEDQQKIKTANLAELELYHLGRDIGETENLAAKEPERLATMAKKLEAMYLEVQEETPVWPEWESPHLEGQRIREHREQLRKADKLPPVPPLPQKKP